MEGRAHARRHGHVSIASSIDVVQNNRLDVAKYKAKEFAAHSEPLRLSTLALSTMLALLCAYRGQNVKRMSLSLSVRYHRFE